MTQKWEQLGTKLLKNDQVAQLNTIRSNHPGDNESCCFDMFKYWLQTNTNASWEQLITELCSPGINFPDVAENLVKQLRGMYVAVNK